MSLGVRAVLVDLAWRHAGGTLDDAWRLVDETLPNGIPETDADLREAMCSVMAAASDWRV